MNKSFKIVLLSSIFSFGFISVSVQAGSYACEDSVGCIRCNDDRAFCSFYECVCAKPEEGCTQEEGCKERPDGFWVWTKAGWECGATYYYNGSEWVCQEKMACDETTKPKGDGLYCDDTTQTWKCGGVTCSAGFNKGECLKSASCACDEAEKPDDGNGWVCDKNTGAWNCSNSIDHWGQGNKCPEGKYKGKCMKDYDCACDEAELAEFKLIGNAWDCEEAFGYWYCPSDAYEIQREDGFTECTYTSPVCDRTQEKPAGDAWTWVETDRRGCYWHCAGEICEDGLMKGACVNDTWNCPCDEAEKPEGDNVVCYYGRWETNEPCVGGPNDGKYMADCDSVCDEADKPDDGDAWQCIDGQWTCHPELICGGGKHVGKCMNSCGCELPADKEGDAWGFAPYSDYGPDACSDLYCYGQICENGSDAGKCMYTCGCDEADKPYEGDAWLCVNGQWECPHYCHGGKNEGKCMRECPCDYDLAIGEGINGSLIGKRDDLCCKCHHDGGLDCNQVCWGGGPNKGKCGATECPCDESEKPEGDCWYCAEEGYWAQREGYASCHYGPNADTCMMKCACDAAPDDGTGWVCDEKTGELSCGGLFCVGGVNNGKCMKYGECDCDEADKPDDGDAWLCRGGVWECFSDTLCLDGPDITKCVTKCACREGCLNCNEETGICND